MLDQLRPLAVFAKTVETGSFRAAASALELSPSVVSHHIAQLETRLGVALLYRSTRRLALTRVGERLFQSARVMLEAAETGLDSVSRQSRQPVGELRITAPAVLPPASWSTTSPRLRRIIRAFVLC
jgi:DNA-binding transcriptional LysR family regulator